MSNQKIFIGGIVLLILIFGGTAVINRTQPGEHDALAQCLTDNGAIFYGAYTCPHCQEQKRLFGRSEKLLPYVECALPGGQGQTQECTNEGIQSYPTWRFADGTELTGARPLARLAEAAGCPF